MKFPSNSIRVSSRGLKGVASASVPSSNTRLNRNHRGIFGLEIAIIVLVLMGIISMFVVPYLTKKTRELKLVRNPVPAT